MSEVVENERAVKGGNRPPIKDFYIEQNAELPAYLESDNQELLERTAALVAAFERMPEVIDSPEVASKFSDQIAQFTKAIKAGDAKREDIKAGPLAAGRLIDGWFAKSVFSLLGHPKDGGGIKAKALARLTVWEQKVAAEERRRLEEVARVAREQQAAAEAAERAERERQRLEAEAAAKAAREAEEKIRNEKDLARAIAMQEEEKVRAAEREAAAKAAAEESERRRQEAEKAQRESTAKAAELATVRGDLGSSSSLRTVWKARVVDMQKVDLNALRDYISKDAVEKAANAYCKIHKDSKPVAGLEFFEETSAVVRG